MKTSKLISTISFNSPNFLAGTIKRLLDSELIEWAHWIDHQAESDETKNHIHLVIQPNKAIDTLQFFKEFIEPVPNDKPLKCLPPNKTSNISDWILYGLHHQGYLASKGETREYTYTIEQMQTTDRDLLLEQYRQALKELNPILHNVKSLFKKGQTLDDILLSGFANKNNLQMIVAYYSALSNKQKELEAKAFNELVENRRQETHQNFEQLEAEKAIFDNGTEILPF